MINSLLPGVPGNNNREFIELFNDDAEATNLEGWSLWYTLAANQEAQPVYRWGSRADIPAGGHYLLARTGEVVGTVPDATFRQPLAVKGRLELRNAEDELVDQVAWGNVSPDLSGGITAAPAPTGGEALVRQGDGHYTLDAERQAANSGSRPEETTLPVALRTPAGEVVSVAPGEKFTYPLYFIENSSNAAVRGVRLSLPIPAGFSVIEAPAGTEETGGRLLLMVTEVPPGGQEFPLVQLQAPWTYTQTIAGGYYVEIGEQRSYAPPIFLSVAGGSIPIGQARQLLGEEVTVEGVATMYTGGFFAGSTGSKFYLEDESGGIQIYVPGGMGVVEVEIGERLQVTGKIERYRDSLELIPSAIPEDVRTVDAAPLPVAEVQPQAISLRSANEDATVLGRLVAVEGTVTRIEEFNYSYEVEIVDEKDDSLLVYIEKDTGISVEPLQVGERFLITGISEIYNGQWQLKPRLQRDFARVYPPELRLALSAPNTVTVGSTLTYTLTATNYTPAPLHEVTIRVDAPGGTGSPTVAGGEGALEGRTLTWQAAEIAGNGGRQVVTFTVEASGPAGSQIVLPPAVATATEWPEPAATGSHLTFVGATVPIWAIQGPGEQSPYILDQVSTAGVVTGVFPDLGGFWIQERETDENPSTSAGLFILAEGVPLTSPLTPGDRVQVTGRVRERSEQTTLELTSPAGVKVLSRDNPLPAALELVPPADTLDAEAYYESREGMLVQVGETAIVVGPTSRYGEYALVRADLGVERVYRGDPAGYLIFVDDGMEIAYEQGDAIPYGVNTGDRVRNVVGPLAYTFGQYKIEPLTVPEVITRGQVVPAMPLLEDDRFSIASYNVENFFDLLDPHPSDPPAPTAAEYRTKVARTAAAIEAMGAPTVIAVQEVENIGILEDVAAEPLLAGYGYKAVLIEGSDSRGIDVGYLVRGDQAVVAGADAYDAPEGLTSRPPLVVTVTLKLADGEQNLYLINNHFTSMAAGEEATAPRRTAQAAWTVTVMETQLLPKDPDAWIAIVGDLNSFYDSQPLDTLRAAGLQHVYELIAPEREYSYIYQGESETLDHILVTPALYQQLVEVRALHINADYAAATDDGTPARASDHDPVIAVFRLAR